MKRFVGTVVALAATVAGLIAAGAAQAAVTPVDGATYDAGTEFTFPCGVLKPRPDAHIVSSRLVRADPRAPRAEGFGVYPTFHSGWDNNNPSKPAPPGVWPVISFVASGGVDQNFGTAPCKQPEFAQADGSLVPGSAFKIDTPGFYHLIEFDVTEHDQPIQPPPFPPDNATCADDTETPDQAHLSYIDAWGDTMVVGHCRHYINIYFTVVAFGHCGGDVTPPYVKAPYINQYDWGRQPGGPPRDENKDPGGNACGSSSLNMMLGNATPQIALYNATALYPVGDGKNNRFDFNKALDILKSEGYKNARFANLGGDVDARGVASENDLSDLLGDGPVITSTLFGDGEWSTAGGGHVILVLSKAAARGAGGSLGDYIVEDPAGAYFSDPIKHYGPRQCGRGASYPVEWVDQLTLHRWAIALGQKIGPRADAAKAPRKGHTAVLLEVPNGISAWVHDRSGHRAGFVGPNQTVGLSGITLDDAPQAPSDPRAPFVSPSALAPAPAISVLDPGKGLTLVASGRRGRRITARMFVYRNGKLVKTATARAVLGSGATKLLSLPYVAGGHNAPLAQLSLKVKVGPGLAPGLEGLSVSSRAPFAGFVSVTVTQGGKSVGAGTMAVKAGPFTVPVFLFPGTKGKVTVTATLSGSGRRVSGSTTATV